MKNSVKIIIGVLVAVTLFFSGWGIPKTIENLKDKKQAVQDSITELNQLLREQFQINQTTVYVLDSLSRSGDSLLWQNKRGEKCMIKVTKK
jgi:predicted nucleic acid-binding protein